MRPRRCLSFPFNATSWFFRALRFFGDGGPIVAALLAAASVKQKNPAEGGHRAAGYCGPEAEARVTFHPADLAHASIKATGCRYDSRRWNPEIALSTLTFGHALCHARRAGGPHLSGIFCAAAPATGKPHG
jgi:hypothetical protein